MKRKIEFKKRQKNPWISFRFRDKFSIYCVKTVQSYTSFSQRHHGWINIKKTKIDQHGNVAWPEQKNEFYQKKNAYLIYFISLNPLNFLWVLFSQTVKILAKLNSTNASWSKNIGFRQRSNHVNFERAFSSARFNSRRHGQRVAKLSAVASGIIDFHQGRNSLEPKKG